MVCGRCRADSAAHYQRSVSDPMWMCILRTLCNTLSIPQSTCQTNSIHTCSVCVYTHTHTHTHTQMHALNHMRTCTHLYTQLNVFIQSFPCALSHILYIHHTSSSSSSVLHVHGWTLGEITRFIVRWGSWSWSEGAPGG